MKLKGIEEDFEVINKNNSFEKLDKIQVPAYDGKCAVRMKEGA